MIYISHDIRTNMKFESTQAESSFGLLIANLTTIVLGAFGNFEQTIQQLTDSLAVKDKTIEDLKAKIHKLEPQPEEEPQPQEINTEATRRQ